MDLHARFVFYGGYFGPIPSFRVGKAFESQTGYRTMLRGSPKQGAYFVRRKQLDHLEFSPCNLVRNLCHIDIGSGVL